MKPRGRNKTRRDGHTQEKAIVDKIELKQQCEREIKAWLKLVRARDFPTDLKAQNQAALIARGIVIKMQVLKAEAGDDELVENMAHLIVREFGQVWEKKSIVLSGPDDGPIDVNLTVKGQMNLTALEEAIRKDQET